MNKFIIAIIISLSVIVSPASNAGDFRNLAKIEYLRTIDGGKYRELLENIDTLGKTLDRMGIHGQPGTFDPQGLNRAIGLIQAFNHKRQYGGIQWRHVPYILQDVQAISKELQNATVIYNRNVNGGREVFYNRPMTANEANAAKGAWAEARRRANSNDYQ